jgi:predicted amidophosphoribosyltransferase
MLAPNASPRTGGHRAGREVTPAASVCGWAAAGVYLASYDCAHAGHELTQLIRRSKSSRERDPELARLVAATAARDVPGFDPELVVSMPPKPGQEDRFRNIRRDVARRLGAADGGPVLSQTRVAADYRQLPITERRLASRGRFSASQAVRGRAVLVIDDVVTSGAQADDAIRALAEAGAAALGFVAIARASAGPGGPARRPRIVMQRRAERRDPLAARLSYDQADG